MEQATEKQKRTRWGQRAILLAVVFVMTVVAAGIDLQSEDTAEGISLACQNSSECREAAAREQEANRNAAAAGESMNLFQAKVSELTAQIQNAEAEIAYTTAQVEELQEQITVTEAKLNDEQEALAELLVNMHFEGDAEPITILAGAESISDLAEKQARNEVVKKQISITAAKVRTAKEQLEADKAEVEELLEEQKEAKIELESTKAEQQALVKKYQNDMESYEAIAKEALEAQRVAEQKEREAHPELYGGSIYTGYNTYPWQDDCPQKQDWFGTSINGIRIGGYVCECVSYAGWKAYEYYGLYLAWGNANTWDDNARRYGYVVDHNPAPNTIGQVDSGTYGHVWWVESVNSDGSVNITEYNNATSTRLYSGVYQWGDFGARTIPASQARQYNYIHLK